MSADPIVNVFAGAVLDRASERRSDRGWVADRIAAASTRAIVLWNGDPLVDEGEAGVRLVRRTLEGSGQGPPDEETLLFLGLDGQDAVFAVDLDGADAPARPASARFAGLRDLALRLSPHEAGLAATAKAVFEWRRRHRFCSVCGAPSRVADAGWKRVCTACGTDHFPRTDPVVIMLPTIGDRCLLGRNKTFRPGVYSALAGFVEPGESLEQACARELKEEADLDCVAAEYQSCQPWPFPTSLMVGLIATVASDRARANPAELEAVRWFSRAEVRALLAGRLEGMVAPQPFAIAHRLLSVWAGEGRLDSGA